MWFDNTPNHTLEEKIQLAVRHYREKLGCVPNICFVNKNALAEDEMQCGQVRVIAARHIRPDYFWLGIGLTLPITKATITKTGEVRKSLARGDVWSSHAQLTTV